MSSIQAIIFDLDGTLLNTLDDLADSTNRVLNQYGYPTHPTEAYKYFVGDGIDKLAFRVLPPEKRDEKNVSSCVKALRDHYGRHWKDQTRLYDGIEDMLSELSRLGIKLAILSNKPHNLTEITVSHYFANWNFAEVAGAIDDIPKKPDPAGAIRIIDKMKIAAENFLYLGDTSTDMKTATGAGVFAIGALWGFRTESELLKSGARAVISNPAEIFNHI
jgi:phosphoglycolate phosphatase